MRNFGVKVSIIEPGYFKTMITSKEKLEDPILSTWEKLPEETKAVYGENYLNECKYLTRRSHHAVSLSPDTRPVPGLRGVPPPRHTTALFGSRVAA